MRRFMYRERSAGRRDSADFARLSEPQYRLQTVSGPNVKHTHPGLQSKTAEYWALPTPNSDSQSMKGLSRVLMASVGLPTRCSPELLIVCRRTVDRRHMRAQQTQINCHLSAMVRRMKKGVTNDIMTVLLHHDTASREQSP